MTRSPNARQLEAFRAVILGGTTTAAAQILNTSQPAISRLLAQLQATCGIKLFEIQRGRLWPTPEARELFNAVQRHFLGIEKIDQIVAALRQSGMGVLRVACTPVLGLSVMPEVIRAFKLEYPSVRLSLETTSTHIMRDGLLNGLHDIALSTSDIRATGLEVAVIHQDRSVCVMPKKHPLALKASVNVRDLRGQPLLAHNPDDAAQQLLQKTMAKHNVTPSSVIETSYSATICVMAAAGLGIGLVSPYAASTFADRIVSRPFSPSILVHTQMARAPHAARSMLATQFEKLLRAHFLEHVP